MLAVLGEVGRIDARDSASLRSFVSLSAAASAEVPGPGSDGVLSRLGKSVFLSAATCAGVGTCLTEGVPKWLEDTGDASRAVDEPRVRE